MIGALFALLPVLVSGAFDLLEPWFGPTGELTPPGLALFRSLVGVVAFWGVGREDLEDPGLAGLYAAYAGAVLDPVGWRGAVVGLLLGPALVLWYRFARRWKGRLACEAVGFLGLLVVAALLGAGLAVAAVWLGWSGGQPTWAFALLVTAAVLLDRCS